MVTSCFLEWLLVEWALIIREAMAKLKGPQRYRKEKKEDIIVYRSALVGICKMQ